MAAGPSGSIQAREVQDGMRVKICGITQAEQAVAIAEMGASALGFICVPSSPRYVSPQQIRAIVAQLPQPPLDRIGVFADAPLEEICQTVAIADLSGVQLHGQESPQFCLRLRAALPGIELIKALRIRDPAALEPVGSYAEGVDTLLLDAYHPQALGGTGQTWDWSRLEPDQLPCPWFLAGGLTPENILAALQQVQPNGIDLSSGVERSPGDKDLGRVRQLFQQLQIAAATT